MIHQRVPMRVSVFIRWLRKPSSFAGRVIVAFMLVIGGVFSFLPVLGLWMLPLGLRLISQDVPFLQKPLVATLAWRESKWVCLKGKWKRVKLSPALETAADTINDVVEDLTLKAGRC